MSIDNHSSSSKFQCKIIITFGAYSGSKMYWRCCLNGEDQIHEFSARRPQPWWRKGFLFPSVHFCTAKERRQADAVYGVSSGASSALPNCWQSGRSQETFLSPPHLKNAKMSPTRCCFLMNVFKGAEFVKPETLNISRGPTCLT